MENTFLPQDYKEPVQNSKYLKFTDGENRIRILGSAIIGWEDWTADNKPVRYKFTQEPPQALTPDRKVKHFWAFPVWDYKDNSVKILEITQTSIRKALQAMISDKEYGDPRGYDIKINKVGKDLDTEYNVMPMPPKPVSEQVKQAFYALKIDMNKLFTGENPFEEEVNIVQPVSTEEVNIEDIPF